MSKRKKYGMPSTEPGPSTSFQCDEGNYFDKHPSELEKQASD